VGRGSGEVTATVQESVELSVVVPVYGCDACLWRLHERLTASLAEITDDYELIFVDDRSPDDSWAVLQEIAPTDPHVRLLRLSRNFGQQAAITAGLTRSRGRRTVVMDCDLQDPPELIPRLYSKAAEGYDIVFARRARRSQSPLRRLASATYFLFLRWFVGASVTADYGAFTMISARAREAFLAIPDADRHYVPILLWIGFDQAVVDYEQAERYAGRSAYSLSTLVRLAVAGVLLQTTTLLRWIIYAGIALALAGMAFAVFLFASYFWLHRFPGWTSLIVVVLTTSGFLALSTGVTGLYVGNIFRQVKGRPLFILDEEHQGGTMLVTESRVEHRDRHSQT
jgi:polyisoprenyl-phosphate glycosyltransferase